MSATIHILYEKDEVTNLHYRPLPPPPPAWATVNGSTGYLCSIHCTPEEAFNACLALQRANPDQTFGTTEV